MSASSTPSYRKVRGGGYTWKGHGRLWMAGDHLLEVNSTFIIESYRRFFFHEVRAFVIQRTNVRRIWGWVFGAVGCIAAFMTGGILWGASVNQHEDWHAALYVPAGFFGLVALVCLVMWIINLALGPSCTCQVLTSTGWHALSAPRRLGPAGQAQAKIAAAIEAVQGLPPSPAAPPPPPVATS